MALKILLENEDIRNQEKKSFKKIMIDEFQDNNGKNRDLLYILSLKEGELEDNGNYIIKPDESNNLISLIIERNEKGEIINDKRSKNKLFFVGDEKQSIYKFRGADVSVFNELTKDNENELISMTYNYRSTPELLSSFNLMFKGGNYIFETTLNKKDYEAYYEKDALKNGMELPALNKENVPVHMNLLNSKRFSDVKDAYDYIPKKDQLAYFMEKKIYETGQNEGNLNNIAILDRSRSDRNNITKYLSMFDIPYEVDQFNNIFQDGIVNDFYNFFRICVYPSDINAYGAYLASPFCGLSVNSVEIILSHLIDYSNKNNVSFTPFPEIKADSDDHISEIDKEISEDITKEEFEKYIAGKSYFQDNRNYVLQQKITTTLSNLWHKKGYKYETLLSQQTELAAEHFDMIFELGRQAESSGKSVSWFVDQLELLKASFSSQDADIDAKGLTYPLERKEAVQIMTIHKSKGLQFDHVFIYGCLENRSKSENATIFFNEKYGVSIRPENGSQNYFFLKEADLFKAKEAAEFRRLIYVAITRAIKDVNIIGAWNPETSSTSQLHMLENATLKFYQNFEEKNQFNDECGFDYNEIEPVEYSQLPIVSRESTDYLRKKAIENTEKFYNEKAELIKYECHAVERKTPSSLEPDFIEKADKDSGAKYEEASDILISSNFSAADFGTLVHAYLEAQANNIEPELFEPPVSLFKNLSNNKIEEAKKECINFTNQFRKSSLGIALDKSKNNKDFYRAEWGFRMFYDDAIFTGSIDLIYSNGDGTYTIVDYKSDNSVEPDKYIGQQHCYRTAASKLLNVDEDKISLYLYFLKHDKIVPLD